MSAIKEIAKFQHEIWRIQHIDRTSFFGWLDILEYYCEKTHEAIGERWRKTGRYGNIVVPSAFNEALKLMETEAQFTKEEFRELSKWLKDTGTPDCAVACILIDYFIGDRK